MNLKKFLALTLALVMVMTLAVGCAKEDATKENEDEVVEEVETNEENGEKVELTISAAASLTDVMAEIQDLYKEEAPNTELSFTFDSSGALQAQIEEGAPVDVFMSAAEKQMDALEESDNIIKDTRKSLLINQVVLITPKDSEITEASFEDLGKENFKKIAIGDPASVPVGQYSEEIFENLELTQAVSDKLVLASNVRTVLNWVEMGEVDGGLVYATDAFTSEDVQIVASAPEGSHKQVTYPVAVIKDSANEDAAKAFVDFLSTDKIAEIFKSYGFEMK